MDSKNISDVAKGKRSLSLEIATRSSDPNFYSALEFLPNPDEILRKMGRSQEVFSAIAQDAHVIGELRSVRSGLTAYERRLQAGGEEPADKRALELCEQYMQQRPSPGMQWNDAFWAMAQGVFKGYAVHEVVWARQGQFLMPSKIVDRPQRRFLFSPQNELRLKTREHMMEGIELGDHKWLLSRHMHTFDNPYGVALFSSCFWPYTFKHNGFRYFMKFCEKYGLPWALGRYPQGTQQSEINKLVDGLAQMVEDAVGAVPEGTSAELVESKIGGGQMAHERMIDMCNREMSKALTSQTLATEIQGDGSRAASQTHREREEAVNASDREMICATMNELFAWITEFNIPNARPPRFEFYEEEDVSNDLVDMLDKARAFMPVPLSYAQDRLQIPAPKNGEDVLPGPAPTPPPVQGPTPPTQFSQSVCPGCGQVHEFVQGGAEDKLITQAVDGADELLDSLVQPVRELLDKVNTMQEFRDGLVDLYPDIDETKVGEYTSLALMVGMLQGVDDAG